jgi:uncharacterized protein (DUF4415 family)
MLPLPLISIADTEWDFKVSPQYRASEISGCRDDDKPFSGRRAKLAEHSGCEWLFYAHGKGDKQTWMIVASRRKQHWKRLRELRAIKDSAIDTGDIPELDARFWMTAKVEVPRAKQAISIRLDPDVLAWFRSQGKGYQSMINAVLKSFVDARKRRY